LKKQLFSLQEQSKSYEERLNEATVQVQQLREENQNRIFAIVNLESALTDAKEQMAFVQRENDRLKKRSFYQKYFRK